MKLYLDILYHVLCVTTMLASFADGKFPANKKYRQLDADGGEFRFMA